MGSDDHVPARTACEENASLGKKSRLEDHASEPGEVLERSPRGSQLPAGSAGNIDRGALGLAFPLCSSVGV